MNAELLIVVVVALLVAGVARAKGWSSPLLLVVVGLLASAIPGLDDVGLDPDLVLFAVLPPLLYSSALESSYRGLKGAVGPITLLAVFLPLITAGVVGLVAYAVLPQLPLAAALVLGAIVAPPDAVSAAAIGRRLGLPRRVMTLLSGESLLNDATALTAYRVALAAAVGTGAGVLSGFTTFALAVVVGVGVGLGVGIVVSRLRRRLDDPVLESSIGLLVPFLTYFAAEELHGSGVLAVVAAGLTLGQGSVRSGYATRLQDDAVWRATDVILESFVFLLIGLQLPAVLDGLAGRSISSLVISSVAVFAAVVLVRLVWVFASTYLPLKLAGRPRDRRPPARGVFVVAWAGMRGVVSLAAAFGIPLTMLDGTDFPARPEILFLTFVVVVGTLLLHGLTLPWLIRRLGVQGQEAQSDAVAEAVAQHDAAEAAKARLDELLTDDEPEAERTQVTERTATMLRGWAERRSTSAWERLGRSDAELGESPARTFRRLRREMLLAERQVFVAHRDAGRIDDEVLRRVMHELDLEEAMLDRD